MRACPECGSVANSGMHFWVFRCRGCGHLYCYLCHGTHGGNTCPDCGSTSYERYGKVE